MADARGCVKNLSHHGRYGKAGTTTCLVLQCLYDAEYVAHMFVSVSMFSLCLCKNAKLFINDVIAEEEFDARSHVGRGWHAQCLGVR